MTRRSPTAGPSPWWTTLSLLTAALALVAAGAAVLHQRDTSRPIGEGELFYADAHDALTRIEALESDGASTDEAVRQVRNSLGIEAVSMTDASGAVIASTSASLEATTVDNPVLASALDRGRFGAVAAPLEVPIEMDGVTRWDDGEVLYAALLPADSGRAVLLYYDVSELLQRRAGARGIQPETLELAGAALVFALASGTTLVGRARTARRYREVEMESQFLRKESEVLQRHNAELRVARSEAERALALAEEKNRIRSEFVLMINHELRTPLTSVVTGGELLRASPDLSEDDRAILDALVHDARRLQTMIDQLLALARVENRGLAFTPQSIPLVQACRVAAGAHSRLIDTHDGHISTDLEVMTDPQTLTQLVASLVDNAYNHGASFVKIDCSSQLAGEPDLVVGDTPDDPATITVIDDGPGIRPEFLPRAFEKFEKDSRSSGTGLGLYMARLMAEAIGAALEVRTSPKGTAISILMPLAPAKVGVPV